MDEPHAPGAHSASDARIDSFPRGDWTTRGRGMDTDQEGRGNVYELNNGMTHAVRNLGGDRVHLIVDWSDEKRKSVTYMKVGEVCVYVGAGGMDCDGGPENRKGQEL